MYFKAQALETGMTADSTKTTPSTLCFDRLCPTIESQDMIGGT